MKPPPPKDEAARLAALHRYRILDTLSEQAYDDITRLAAYITQSPIALISLIDDDRQWFKSKIGLTVTETPREYAFCTHAILNQKEPLVVRDATEDERFADNPLVTDEPRIRFYTGAPLVTPDQHAIGTLCVIDRVPRDLTGEQIFALSGLSRQVVAQLELRRHAQELLDADAERERYLAELKAYQKQLEEANLRLQEESMTDKLTGVGNRAAFDRRLTEEIYHFVRYAAPTSLLLIDVDHFKEYNDSFGHLAGDDALKIIAAVLRDCARPSDFIGRYGGEEFAVILSETAGAGALGFAERLRASVAAARLPHRRVTVSIGAATVSAESANYHRLIELADTALYAAKQQGRNCVVHKASG